jgi:hypothetical protein
MTILASLLYREGSDTGKMAPTTPRNEKEVPVTANLGRAMVVVEDSVGSLN